MVDAVRRCARELVALGVVAVQDPGSMAARSDLGGPLEAYRRLAAGGDLPLRVHASIRAEQLAAAREAGVRSGRPLGPDPLDRLRLGWLKIFADGSLGSRTAALLEPMERAAGEAAPPNDGLGVWLATPKRLGELAADAASIGIATQIHAIGDAAVRAALDALAPTVGATPLMPRVEHAQLVADDDVARFAALAIAASVQPVHLRSDVDKARALWAGDRAERRAFPLAALASTGAVVAFGTDAPVEPLDPWPGIACAVTRSAPSWPPGTAPLGPSQALSLWRAIRATCLDPAISAGELDRGRLVAGHRADIVVLPAAAIEEPVEPGGALWNARPRLVLRRRGGRGRRLNRRSAGLAQAAERLGEQPVEDPRGAGERVDRLGQHVDLDVRLDREDALVDRGGRVGARHRRARRARASPGRPRSSRARSRPRPSSPWRCA